MSQDSKTLVNSVKQYFDQNVHDTKNLFGYLNLWLESTQCKEGKNEARAMLQEMQSTYGIKIAALRDDFDRFLSVVTLNVDPVRLESLADWLSSYLDTYWQQQGEPGKLTKELDPDVSLAYPPAYLSSIINSLLDNAVQYQSDERELMVWVALEQKAETAVLQVRDNGIGIDTKQHRNALFQPFRRFSSKGEGKGLSLHLVKTMVERNGGNIDLASSVGVGSIVEVHLKSYN